jgi:hypothetical protein
MFDSCRGIAESPLARAPVVSTSPPQTASTKV